MADTCPLCVRRPEKFLKKNVVNSKTPFDSASGISAEAITEKEKARINRGLWKEHKEFMEKLHRKRQLRARVEVRHSASPIS